MDRLIKTYNVCKICSKSGNCKSEKANVLGCTEIKVDKQKINEFEKNFSLEVEE